MCIQFKVHFFYSEFYSDYLKITARLTLIAVCNKDWRIRNGAYGSATYSNR